MLRALQYVLAFSAAVAAMGAGSFALADRPRVVLVGPSRSHPTVARVREELEALGIEVDVLEQGSGGSDLAELARERHAAAAARVEDRPPEIVVWVQPTQRTGDATEGVEIRVSESVVGPAESALLALRATELLRGKLIPIPPESQADGGSSSPDAGAERPSAPSRSQPKPPPAPAQPAPKTTPGQFSAWVGAAALLSPGGVPATPQIRLGGGYRPLRRLGFEATAFIPPASATVSTLEGTIDVRTFAFGANAALILTDPEAAFGASAGLGGAALLLIFEGDARPPFVSARGDRWAALPYASICTSYRLHPLFAVRADTIMGMALPEPVVRAAGRAVASTGRPAVFLSLGIEVRL